MSLLTTIDGRPGTVAGRTQERHSSPAGLGARILSASVTNAMFLCCAEEYRFPGLDSGGKSSFLS